MSCGVLQAQYIAKGGNVGGETKGFKELVAYRHYTESNSYIHISSSTHEPKVCLNGSVYYRYVHILTALSQYLTKNYYFIVFHVCRQMNTWYLLSEQLHLFQQFFIRLGANFIQSY